MKTVKKYGILSHIKIGSLIVDTKYTHNCKTIEEAQETLDLYKASAKEALERYKGIEDHTSFSSNIVITLLDEKEEHIKRVFVYETQPYFESNKDMGYGAVRSHINSLYGNSLTAQEKEELLKAFKDKIDVGTQKNREAKNGK